MASVSSFRYVRLVVFTISGVEVAERFIERWRGLRPRPDGRSMIIPGASVHAFGMREPVWAVGLDASDVVIERSRIHDNTYGCYGYGARIAAIPSVSTATRK